MSMLPVAKKIYNFGQTETIPCAWLHSLRAEIKQTNVYTTDSIVFFNYLS